MLGAGLDAVFRAEHARLMASVARLVRDLDVAEDAAQEAFVRASTAWPRDGLPDKPGAWLQVVARNVAMDLLRRRAREVPGTVHLEEAIVAATTGPPSSDDGSETLALVFACCRADLPPLTRMTLALRLVLGLRPREIARLLLEEESATAQRLVRARRELAARQERFEPPPRAAWREHLELAATTIYLLFTEGYAAATGRSVVRVEAAARAIELGRLLVRATETPTTLALLALMLLHHARAGARTDAHGELLTLEEQDRSRWDASAIEEALALLDRAISESPRVVGPDGGPDPYVLQAAIAALHCRARSAAETDWAQIAALYGGLLRVAPSPVVELNAAVALAMAGKLEAGLRWVNEIERRRALDDHAPLALAKAELLFRSGVLKQAERGFRRARRLSKNDAERRYIARRIRALFGGGRQRP